MNSFQKGFILIPVLIAYILAGVVVGGVAGYEVAKQQNSSDGRK